MFRTKQKCIRHTNTWKGFWGYFSVFSFTLVKQLPSILLLTNFKKKLKERKREKPKKVFNVLVPFFSFQMNVDPTRSQMSFRLWSFFFLWNNFRVITKISLIKRRKKNALRSARKKEKRVFCVGKFCGSCEWDQISRGKKIMKN